MFIRQCKIWSFHVVVLQRTVKKCTKSYNARAEPLFCSLNLSLSDASVAVVVFLSLVLIFRRPTWDMRIKRVSFLKCLWSEIFFHMFLKYTVWKTWFQSFTCLGLKWTILQAFKVVPFCPQKWQGNGSELSTKFLNVTSFGCQKFVYALKFYWK